MSISRHGYSCSVVLLTCWVYLVCVCVGVCVCVSSPTSSTGHPNRSTGALEGLMAAQGHIPVPFEWKRRKRRNLVLVLCW